MPDPKDVAKQASDALALLGSKLAGDSDGEAALVVAALTANLAELLGRLAEAERRMGAAAGAAAKSLVEVDARMQELIQLSRRSDQEVAALQEKLHSTLSEIQQLSSKADTGMRDVLQTYAQFQGTTAQLKHGISGMAKALLTQLGPLSGPLGARVDGALGLP